MKTPQEKYENDAPYTHLVDTIEKLIHNAQFTPSEVREAAILACIHFEMRSSYRFDSVPSKVNDALECLAVFRKSLTKVDE